jgi:hypothetical protein
MAISHGFANAAIWLKISGEVTRQEVSEGIYQAITDERFITGSYLVIDLQDTQTNFSSGDLRLLATFLKDLGERISSPIIATVSDSFHFGLMRMLQVYAESCGFEVKVFTQADRAVEWLSIHRQEERRDDI